MQNRRFKFKHSHKFIQYFYFICTSNGKINVGYYFNVLRLKLVKFIVNFAALLLMLIKRNGFADNILFRQVQL